MTLTVDRDASETRPSDAPTTTRPSVVDELELGTRVTDWIVAAG